MEDLSSCQRRQDLLRAAVALARELTQYLGRRGAHPSDAQDLMQEVYLRILKIQSLKGIEHPRAYLYKVATSVAYEHRLRRAAIPVETSWEEATEDAIFAASALEGNGPEAAAALRERLNSLATRLNELPPRVRNAVLWHHHDGYTCDEIADKLSAATHRVKKYLVKGLAHCREGRLRRSSRSAR